MQYRRLKVFYPTLELLLKLLTWEEFAFFKNCMSFISKIIQIPISVTAFNNTMNRWKFISDALVALFQKLKFSQEQENRM